MNTKKEEQKQKNEKQQQPQDEEQQKRFLNLDIKFISVLVKEGKNGVVKAKERLVREEWIGERWLPVYKFIFDFFKKYSDVPTKDVIENKFGVDLLDTAENLDFLIDELKNRWLYDILKIKLSEVVKDLTDKKPERAITKIEDFVSLIRREGVISTEIVDVLNLKGLVKDAYYKAKNGGIGIEIPFPTLHRALLGWQRGEIYGIFSRSKRGKTQLLLVFSHHAWKTGNRVLFVSPEMTKLSLARRFFALELATPLQKIRSGELGEFAEEDFFNKLENINGVPFYVLAEESDMDINSVEAAIEKTEPDLLVIDGIYLVKCPGDDLIERMGNMAEILKVMVRRYKIPIIISSQFNRTVKQNASRAEVSAIALSDRMAWTLDVCLGILQDSTLKALNRIRLVPLVLREVEDFDEIILNWDFKTQNFTEVLTENMEEVADVSFDDIRDIANNNLEND